jgi:hypothetical protein
VLLFVVSTLTTGGGGGGGGGGQSSGGGIVSRGSHWMGGDRMDGGEASLPVYHMGDSLM